MVYGDINFEEMNNHVPKTGSQYTLQSELSDGKWNTLVMHSSRDVLLNRCGREGTRTLATLGGYLIRL